MSSEETLRRFFETYEAPKDSPRVEIRRGLWTWKAVPLEWNGAKKLARMAGVSVRLVSASGLVTMQMDPDDLRQEGA